MIPETSSLFSTPTAGTQTQSAQSRLASDFNSFLSLLTTQLQHQDPLSPLESTEFTSQLAQFAQVEQGIGTNDRLDQLLRNSGQQNLEQNSDVIGKWVEIQGQQVTLQEQGSAWLGFRLPEATEQVAVQIADAQGRVVRTALISGQSGANRLLWDGATDAGTPAPPGQYFFGFQAINAQGQELNVTPTQRAQVSEVVLEDGVVRLVIANQKYTWSDIFGLVAAPDPITLPDLT